MLCYNYSMKKIFEAGSVVIVGVSDWPTNLGRNILQNLIDWGYRGNVYGVNPKGGEALGYHLHASIAELPEAPDLAVAIVPAIALPGLMEECGRRGITRMAIPAGGFEELGEEGKELQRRIKEIASRYGIRFVGPNCLTVINSSTGLCLPFIPVPPDLRSGGVGVIAQSGGIGLDFLIRLFSENVGFSKFVSMGNKADLDEVDYLEYLGSDEQTEVICLYLEDVARGREFLQVVEKIRKPVLVYKANTQPLTRESAQSHTAALANDDAVLEGALRQAGALRVHRLTELAGYAKVFSLPPLKGNRIALVSPTGGLLVLGADRCAHHGFEFPRLHQDLIEEIRAHLRAGVINIGNPVDLGDVHDPDSRLFIVDRLMAQDYIDGVVLILISRMSTEPIMISTGGLTPSPRNIMPDLEKLSLKHGKPLVFGLLSNDLARYHARRSTELPIFSDAEEAVDAAAALRDHWRGLQRKTGEP